MESKSKDYKNKQSLERIRWAPPTCVAAGETFPIPPDSISSTATQADIADQFSNGYAEWKVEGAARVIDAKNSTFTFESPGEATIKFVLNYDSGPAPRKHEVTVARLKSDGSDCHVRTRSPLMPVTYTYTRNGDYSELPAPEGGKIYMGVNRFAPHIPEEGGWISIPPSSQAMMQARFNAGLGRLPDLPPWADRPDEGFSARLPWVFQEWWGYREITNRMEDGPEIAAIARYNCPPEVVNCKEISMSCGGESATLKYDDFNRLIAMHTVEGDLTFEHRIFDIGRPPGWEDRPNLFRIPEMPRPAPRPSGGRGGGGGGGSAASSAATAAPGGSGTAASGTTASSSGGAQECNCSCAGLLKAAANPACAMQCGQKWAQCLQKW